MKKLISLILVIVVVYGFSEFFGDRIIKGIVEKNISNSLDQDTKIESLKINYLKGEAIAKNIKLYNKNFSNDLLFIENAYVKLKSTSIFSNNVEIYKVDLKGINLNYFFNLKNAKINDNVRSLSKTLKEGSGKSNSSKYFNIEKITVQDIYLSVNSPELKIKDQISLNNLEFKNVGNSQTSNNYKDIIHDFVNQIIITVKSKVLKGNVKEKLNIIKNIDEDVIKKTIKEKLKINKEQLKNKLKKLIK
tara:strand:- start:2111 stop:2851 length:741 start_codon:yes stop_codon:yes gene_type:complete